MGKRKEVAFEEKVSLVEEYLAGRLRMREAARRAGVGHSTMESWISRYRSEGISALEENGNRSKRKYSEDFKRQVAEEYLSGQGQFYGHRGKVSFALRESGIGLGKGVS
ncbi:hypothetical protein LAWASA_3719 [Lawsonibacter asaccharolyticus]|nr:hypothetical protein LAWASA_3719 [Lawsonibacter asaccharolyticus]